MITKPISIVTERLIPVGKTSVREFYPEKVAKEIAKFKADIKKAENDKTGMCNKKTLEVLKEKLANLLENAEKTVTMITKYTDSKGAKYEEILTKDSYLGPGAPVRKLVKVEEEYMKDGRKIVTRTTHDKSDSVLWGEGHQDGVITKVEEFYTKEGVKVGRRTTTQEASGYGGKGIEKEVSKDGCELSTYNTAKTVTHFTEDGKRVSRTSVEPGDILGTTVLCNERGIPQIKPEAFKAGW